MIATQTLIDREEIIRAAGLYVPGGRITELRILNGTSRGDRYPQTYSGFFDSAETMANAVGELNSWSAVYFVPNEIDPSLLARAANRLRAVKKDPLTSDNDVLRRRWLLVDVDPVRPAGISSTDEQHAEAIALAERIRGDLTLEGWHPPILADSGNGGHATYLVDLAADDGGLIERCLQALAAKYDTPAVHVDTGVFNPARIWKLPGTLACKGDDTPDRPHRMAKLLYVPDKLTPIPLHMLEQLAEQAPQEQAAPQNKRTHHANGRGDFDIGAWIARHSLKVHEREAYKGGHRWRFKVCPWNESHTDGSAFLLRLPSGAIAAGCHHAGCAAKDWHALRDIVEPGWRNQKSNGSSSRNGESATPPEEEQPATPAFVSCRELCRDHPHLRPPIIHGVLRQGETANVVGAPKSMKSWLVKQAALSVASGRAFLDTFPVERGDVLILDNELHPETIANRIPRLVSAMGLMMDEVSDHLFIESLRGRLRNIHGLASYFLSIEPGRFRLIVLDAMYRLLPAGTDENSNADMASIYNSIDRYAAHVGCAFLVVHHTSKGVQAGKAVTDVGSGAGSMSRAADAHLILRPHEEEGAVVCEAVVRSWPPVSPICLRWNYPIWEPAADLDPTKLRETAKRKKSPEPEASPAEAWTPARFAAQFVTADPRSESTITTAAEVAGLKERKAKRLLLAGVEVGIVHRWTAANPSTPHRFATVEQPVCATENGGVK